VGKVLRCQRQSSGTVLFRFSGSSGLAVSTLACCGGTLVVPSHNFGAHVEPVVLLCNHVEGFLRLRGVHEDPHRSFPSTSFTLLQGRITWCLGLSVGLLPPACWISPSGISTKSSKSYTSDSSEQCPSSQDAVWPPFPEASAAKTSIFRLPSWRLSFWQWSHVSG
jgi:hypothetical protein